MLVTCFGIKKITHVLYHSSWILQCRLPHKKSLPLPPKVFGQITLNKQLFYRLNPLTLPLKTFILWGFHHATSELLRVKHFIKVINSAIFNSPLFLCLTSHGLACLSSPKMPLIWIKEMKITKIDRPYKWLHGRWSFYHSPYFTYQPTQKKFR